jgi:hypothetical protein
MTASEDQAKAERSITEFAATVPLAVNSIESRHPPEPDLLGDVEGEGPVAFEERQVTNESLERCNAAGTIKRAKSFAPHAEHSRLNLVSESWTVLVVCLPFSFISDSTVDTSHAARCIARHGIRSHAASVALIPRAWS